MNQTLLFLPVKQLVPYPPELLPELRVAPGVDDGVVAGAGHGHQVADEECKVVELPAF